MTDHKKIIEQVNNTIADMNYYKMLIEFKLMLNSKIKADDETYEKLYNDSIKLSDGLKMYYEFITELLKN